MTSSHHYVSGHEYGPRAFNSQRIIPQALPPKRGFMDKLLLRQFRDLGFQRAGRAICASALNHIKPIKFKKLRSEKSPWNEQVLTAYGHSWHQVLSGCVRFLASVIFYGIPTIILPIVAQSANMGLIIQDLFFYVWLPCLVIWLMYQLSDRSILKSAWLFRQHRNFMLHRTTGMVQLFDKNDRLYFEAPFVEFDPLLAVNPNMFNTPYYQLVLHHRYSNHRQRIFAKGLLDDSALEHDECLRLWCMIQRYMDTSQPMPDILPLEAGRPNDPVTIAYDRERGRPERFWRDLSHADCKRLLHKGRYTSSIRNDVGEDIDLFAGAATDSTGKKNLLTRLNSAL